MTKQPLPPNLLPSQYRPLAYIAGGYAACSVLANDMDVWVTQQVDLNETRKIILDHLQEQNYIFDDLNILWNEDYQGVEIQILKVALVKPVFPTLPIHIMVTNGNIDAVLYNFDISTHQIAIAPNGEEILGPRWTPLDMLPVVLLENVKTADRLIKITDRYERFRHGKSTN